MADMRAEYLIEQERLILAATEHIWELLADQGVPRFELAQSLGMKTRRLDKLLNGEREMTLRLYAEIVGHLGHRAHITTTPFHERTTTP